MLVSLLGHGALPAAGRIVRVASVSHSRIRFAGAVATVVLAAGILAGCNSSSTVISPDAVKKLLASSPGIVLVDDPKQGLYPMPKDVEGRYETFVGRVRRDPFVKNGLWLWVVADNLLKGAASNAVQIAESL